MSALFLFADFGDPLANLLRTTIEDKALPQPKVIFKTAHLELAVSLQFRSIAPLFLFQSLCNSCPWLREVWFRFP